MGRDETGWVGEFIWVHVHIGCALRDGQTGVEVR